MNQLSKHFLVFAITAACKYEIQVLRHWRAGGTAPQIIHRGCILSITFINFDFLLLSMKIDDE